jgi:HEAT repeat protein
VPALADWSRAEDAGVRKTAVHALGGFATPEARAALAAALADPVEDVRWNAAIALARRRDAAAAPVLLEVLDRAHLDGVSGMTEEQRVAALVQAVEAAAVVPDERLRPALERLRDHDPSLKVREAARAALGGTPASPATRPS